MFTKLIDLVVNDSNPQKRLLRWGVTAFVVAQTAMLGGILSSVVNLSPTKWSLFFNSKLPQAWFNLSAVFLTLLAIEWITTGQTVRTITDVDKQSSSEDKRTAAYFMIGMGLIAAIAVKGGF